MSKFFIKVCFFLVFLVFTSVQAKDNCAPEFDLAKPSSIFQPADNNNNEDQKSTFIYFDQSLSMQGYTINQPGHKNFYVSVIDDLQQIAENVGDKTYYHSFGKRIMPIKEKISKKYYTIPILQTQQSV